MRFKVKFGDFEVELEGDDDYVKSKFEEILSAIPLEARLRGKESGPLGPPRGSPSLSELEGIMELTSDGKLYLTVPGDSITSKEALGLLLYAVYPNKLTDEELSDLLSLSWKPTRREAVRARASELKREGKIIAEGGKYGLSGVGVQWVKGEVIAKLKQ